MKVDDKFQILKFFAAVFNSVFLYMGFLICIVLGQLFVTFIILLSREKITSEMKMEVNKTMTEYGTNPDNQRHWKLLDDVQRYGCQKIITDWLKENTLTIVGMDMGLLIIQVLQLIVSVYLYQTVGQKAKLRCVSQLIRSEDHREPNPDDLDDPDYPEQILAYPEPRQAYSEDQHQAYSGPNHAYHR
ncbi:unnamed protein product [Coregonus sp. 'balchen']|nr:unnamed protein product [Coregonus sp. 'balchen']